MMNHPQQPQPQPRPHQPAGPSPSSRKSLVIGTAVLSVITLLVVSGFVVWNSVSSNTYSYDHSYADFPTCDEFVDEQALGYLDDDPARLEMFETLMTVEMAKDPGVGLDGDTLGYQGRLSCRVASPEDEVHAVLTVSLFDHEKHLAHLDDVQASFDEVTDGGVLAEPWDRNQIGNGGVYRTVALADDGVEAWVHFNEANTRVTVSARYPKGFDDAEVQKNTEELAEHVRNNLAETAVDG